MQINADFANPALVKTGELEWSPSPMRGVHRRMLDRIGGEVARATSIVRYAVGSAFPEHTHSGGEEFIVLEGTFQDEHGDYPAGTYVRNPVGTHHVPRADNGCTIFVKLWQFDPDDQEQFSVDLDTLSLKPDPERADVLTHTLAKRHYETVCIEQWGENSSFTLCESGGFEILILEGALTFDGEAFGRHDWIRWPDLRQARFTTGEAGARLWIKRGHLHEIRRARPVA